MKSEADVRKVLEDLWAWHNGNELCKCSACLSRSPTAGAIAALGWVMEENQEFTAMLDGEIRGRNTIPCQGGGEEMTDTDLKAALEFQELVRQMRRLQKEYFKTRHASLLPMCRDMERRVDRALEPKDQPQLPMD